MLTPLFVAGSIVEETDRRTLEFLLATDLRPREIVLGKLWPRLLLVFGVVLVGWPVLAVTQVWGGVDVVFVGLASVVVLAELWAVAGISAACAVGATSLRKAMVRSYLWSAMALTLPLCTCPVGVIVALSDADAAYAEMTAAPRGTRFGPPPPAPSSISVLVGTAISLGVHLLVQFLIGLWGLRRATYKLRHARYFYARMPWQQRPRKPQKWEQHPPVPQGSPLLWKEIHLSGQTNRFVRSLSLIPAVVWLCVASVFTLVGWALSRRVGGRSAEHEPADPVGRRTPGRADGRHGRPPRGRQRGPRAAAGDADGPPYRPPAAVRDPRGQVGRQPVKARGVAIGAAAVPLVGVIAEGLSYWAVVPLVLAAFAFLGCAASFGLWLSVRAPTVQRASGLWLLAAGLWVGGTFLAAEAAYLDQRPPAPVHRPGTRRPSRRRSSGTGRSIRCWPGPNWCFATARTHGPRYGHESWDGEAESVFDVWPSFVGIGTYLLLAWALTWPPAGGSSGRGAG